MNYVEERDTYLNGCLVLYSLLLYLLCVIIPPPDSPEGLDQREFSVSKRKWFSGVILVPASVDIVDSPMKNHAAPAEAGYVFIPAIVMALLTRSSKYHAVLATSRSLTVPDRAHPPRLHFPSSLRSS